MPVFDDPKKELQRLQEQLLKDEAWFERELDSAKRMIGEDPGKKTSRPAPVRTQTGRVSPGTMAIPPEPQEEAEPPRKGIRGLVILAVLETLGIVGVVAYWLLVLLK